MVFIVLPLVQIRTNLVLLLTIGKPMEGEVDMCHTDKNGDGCYRKGEGGCGGNLLQTNITEGQGVRGVVDRLRSQVLDVRSSIASYQALRGK